MFRIAGYLHTLVAPGAPGGKTLTLVLRVVGHTQDVEIYVPVEVMEQARAGWGNSVIIEAEGGKLFDDGGYTEGHTTITIKDRGN